MGLVFWLVPLLAMVWGLVLDKVLGEVWDLVSGFLLGEMW